MNTPANQLASALKETLQNETSIFSRLFTITSQQIRFKGFRSRLRAQKGVANILRFPIIQPMTSALPIAYVAISESSYGTLPALGKLLMVFPTVTEWPLFFTTLRIVVSSVTG